MVLKDIGRDLREAAPKLWTFDVKEVGFWAPKGEAGDERAEDLPDVRDFLPSNCAYDELPQSLVDKLRPSPENDTIVHSYELAPHFSRIDGTPCGCANLMVRRGRTVWMFPESLKHYVVEHGVRLGGQDYNMEAFIQALREEGGTRERLMLWEDCIEVAAEDLEATEAYLLDHSSVCEEFKNKEEVSTCPIL